MLNGFSVETAITNANLLRTPRRNSSNIWPATRAFYDFCEASTIQLSSCIIVKCDTSIKQTAHVVQVLHNLILFIYWEVVTAKFLITVAVTYLVNLLEFHRNAQIGTAITIWLCPIFSIFSWCYRSNARFTVWTGFALLFWRQFHITTRISTITCSVSR